MAKDKTSLAQDVTKAINLTLRPSRVAVVALGLLIGVAAAILFFWLGGLIKPQGLQWLGWIVRRLGALVFAYVALASIGAAVAMGHAESEGEKISVPAGWALIGKNITPVVLGTLKPIFVFVVLVAFIWVLGAIGAIPEVGPIVWSIISIAPVAAGVLAILVLAKVFLVSFLFPTVLCVNKDKGTTTYKESVKLIKGHAADMLGRIAVAVLICFVLYKIIVAGFAFTASHSSKTMGNNRATLRGSRLLEYVAGVPGITATAPLGFSVRNPALPFRNASYTANALYFRTAMAPTVRMMGGDPSEAAREVGVRLGMKATQKVGGWVFSIILIVLSVVLFSLPYLFFAFSGYCAYQSLKDAPELALRAEEVVLSEIKETAQEIAGKRKGKEAEKTEEESTE